MSKQPVAGIYKITNLTDGKSYIGQSFDIKARKTSHFSKLKSHKHHNPPLQNAYNIDGEPNFIYELVTEVIIPTEMDYDSIILKHYLTLAEEHNIEWFNSRVTENGYNIREVNDSNLGLEYNSGVNNPLYGGANCKSGCESFLHFPNGKHYFVKSIPFLSKEFNLNPNYIWKVVAGKHKQHKGITGGKAPKWLVDKVKPLMKERQYWVEIDEQGNIIE